MPREGLLNTRLTIFSRLYLELLNALPDRSFQMLLEPFIHSLSLKGKRKTECQNPEPRTVNAEQFS
jgi:hypothetical protein